MNDSKQKGKSPEEQPKSEEQPKVAEQPKETKADSTDDVLRFQLKQNKLMWNSRSGNIKLSAFRQETGGSVSKKNRDDYIDVDNAIRLDLLERVEKGKGFQKFETKELTAGAREADRQAKIKKSYNTDEYLKMKQEEVMLKVKDIDDPRLVIALIQAEKKGDNETGVERPNVMSKLRKHLQQIDKQGLYEYDGDL